MNDTILSEDQKQSLIEPGSLLRETIGNQSVACNGRDSSQHQVDISSSHAQAAGEQVSQT